MARTLRIETVYAHTPEKMWDALSTSEALAEWLMPNTFKPIVGHVFEFRTRPAPGFDGIVTCQVLEVVPPKRLAFTWAGGGVDTVVSFDLSPVENGTRLRFSQSGFRGAKGWLVSAMLENGWRAMIDRKLRRVLAAGPGRVRAEGEGETTFWRWFNKLTGRKESDT